MFLKNRFLAQFVLGCQLASVVVLLDLGQHSEENYSNRYKVDQLRHLYCSLIIIVAQQ